MHHLPIALPGERFAVMRLFLDLATILRASIFEQSIEAESSDGTVLLVGAAVALGHAESRPFSETKLANYLRMPRSTVQKKLKILLECRIIVCHERKYYLEPHRAAHPKDAMLERYAQVLATATAALGPWLDHMRERANSSDAREEFRKIESAIGMLIVAAKALEGHLAVAGH